MYVQQETARKISKQFCYFKFPTLTCENSSCSTSWPVFDLSGFRVWIFWWLCEGVGERVMCM